MTTVLAASFNGPAVLDFLRVYNQTINFSLRMRPSENGNFEIYKYVQMFKDYINQLNIELGLPIITSIFRIHIVILNNENNLIQAYPIMPIDDTIIYLRENIFMNEDDDYAMFSGGSGPSDDRNPTRSLQNITIKFQINAFFNNTLVENFLFNFRDILTRLVNFRTNQILNYLQNDITNANRLGEQEPDGELFDEEPIEPLSDPMIDDNLRNNWENIKFNLNEHFNYVISTVNLNPDILLQIKNSFIYILENATRRVYEGSDPDLEESNVLIGLNKIIDDVINRERQRNLEEEEANRTYQQPTLPTGFKRLVNILNSNLNTLPTNIQLFAINGTELSSEEMDRAKFLLLTNKLSQLELEYLRSMIEENDNFKQYLLPGIRLLI